MAGTTIGYHCSHEQHPPGALLQQAVAAAAAGFEAAMCSDHFAPWMEQQGHSGYAWSWLGAALHATPLSFGTVTAPGQRYHPAIVAQAAATLASMYPGRFWLALGSGEALNEAITGDRWPAKSDRNARLRECADIMRALWAGETVTHHGHVRVRDAQLYVRPDPPPLLLGAAITPDTARWLGEWADGLITVAGEPDDMKRVVEAFQQHGAGKPMFLQVTLSYAPSENEALDAAMTQWRQGVLGVEKLAELSSPAAFARESAKATADDVRKMVRVSADVQRHLAWLQEDAALGFERIYLHNVARDHLQRFVETWAERVLPSFR